MLTVGLMRKDRTFKRRAEAALLAILIWMAATAVSGAQGEERAYDFDIREETLGSALDAIVRQTKLVVLYPNELARNRDVNPVIGRYTVREAIDELLRGTAFSGGLTENGVIYISLSGTEKTDHREAEMNTGKLKTTLLAGAAAFLYGTGAYGADVALIEDQDEAICNEGDRDCEREKADEIVVTGTNIRGIAPESSPTRAFNREDIQITGAATAQDFIQTLPENFGGGANSDIKNSIPGDSASAFNGSLGSYGSSVNLRGLGAGSTLVLLNGHRVAPSSGIGDFVDISMIPASALERVDVLSDGASSIYGADAVAGVVNFVLRDDFDGAEASFRYGTVTEGHLNEYRAGLTAGKNWNTGNALIAYEYFDQDSLSAGDRSFSANAALPNNLLPSQQRHSVLSSVSQELNPALKVFGDFTFSSRESRNAETLISGEVARHEINTSNYNVTVGGVWEVSDSWIADVAGTHSDLEIDRDRIRFFPQPQESTDSRKISSTIWAADVKASGPLFTLPGGEVKLGVGGHFRSEKFSNIGLLNNIDRRIADRDVFAAFGEAFIPLVGPDNALPGIRRLEINASGRYSDFSDFGSTANPKVGVLWSPVEPLRLRGSYSTSFNPPPLGRVGANDRNVVAYSSAFFNTIFNVTAPDSSIEDIVVLMVGGTAADLDAENSRALTAGIDFDQKWNGNNISFTATWFDIEFENRLGATPCPGCAASFVAQNIAFSNPDAFPAGTFIFNPSPDQINDAIALGSFDPPVFPIPSGTDPFAAEVINFVPLVRNLSLTRAKGLDFGLEYSKELDLGSVLVGVNGTYLKDFQQQATATSALVQQVSRLYNPVGLKLRGHAGFTQGGFAANLFVNYTNDYTVDGSPGSTKIDSWTTVDLSLSYNTGGDAGRVWDDIVLRLSVLNLFDTNPPATPSDTSLQLFGYDPANASPLGRFIAFEVTKRF